MKIPCDMFQSIRPSRQYDGDGVTMDNSRGHPEFALQVRDCFASLELLNGPWVPDGILRLSTELVSLWCAQARRAGSQGP